MLALGQSNEGAQGGTVATFASALPAYVDVVAPSFLVSDDRLDLPVQVVSQQAGGVSESLSVPRVHVVTETVVRRSAASLRKRSLCLVCVCCVVVVVVVFDR